MPCIRYNVLSILPQPLAWAVHMMYNGTVHTKGCLATYYFVITCVVYCCHLLLCCVLLPFLLVLYITNAIVCLCCMLLPTFLSTGAIATIVRTVCCCHCLYHYCHYHYLYCKLLLSIAFSVCCHLPLFILYVNAAIACILYIHVATVIVSAVHSCYYCLFCMSPLPLFVLQLWLCYMLLSPCVLFLVPYVAIVIVYVAL